MYFIPLLVIIIIWLPLLFFMRWRYYRMPLLPKDDIAKEGNEALPITVIIPLDHDADGLYELLASIFNQHYDGSVHVLIANYSGDKAIEDNLLRIERDFRNLKHTNITTTPHIIDKEKLAVSVALKGARTEWVMLMDVDVNLPSPNWLRAMTEACKSDYDIIVGYSNYVVSKATTTLWQYDVHFQNIQAYSQGCYTGGVLHHVLIRKSHFLNQMGYSNRHMRLTIGTLPLLVDYLSRTGRACVSLCSDTSVFKTQASANGMHQESLAHNIIYYYSALKTKILDTLYSISTCFLLTLPLLLLYTILQNVMLWVRHFGSEMMLSSYTLIPNSPMIWEVALHTLIVIALLATLCIPLRWLQKSFTVVGLQITYPKLLIYPFLLPFYRTNKRILAFFYRKKCVRRL